MEFSTGFLNKLLDSAVKYYNTDNDVDIIPNKLSNTKIAIEKFSDALDLLNDLGFIQVHKSFAVSKKHIKSIEGNQIFILDNIIPIGKLYKANVLQMLK